VDFPLLIDSHIDPATSYDPGGWSVLGATNDGLVSFKRAGGEDGTQLVPDLAASLPTPTDGGKTYAFQLRKGISYSTGGLVKASDVRATFERLFRAHSPRLDYYARIAGGSACLKRPTACDLSRGIVTDDDAGTVTFHLTAPDAEFLQKLAIPFGFVLPAGTPVSPTAAQPLPATGAYMLQSHTPKRLKLVRNPHFRVWDTVARPAGYPDEIVAALVPAARAASDVARGRADVANGFAVGFGDQQTEFEIQHPGQVHTTPAAATFYWFLNTRVPPFDNVRARRAVNYALDRAALIRILGGSEAAQLTCQILPPNFPGYSPYCPYTANAGAGGTWSGPDLAKAPQLVRESGTQGARVSFWLWANARSAAVARLARTVFAELGYRPSIRLFPDLGAYYRALSKAPPSEPQAGVNGWLADFPAASNFFETLTCAAVADRGTNSGSFCSHPLDREIERASSLQTQDQGAAARLWARIDRQATDLAPWVSTYTPRTVDLVSKRVGNYQFHPLFGALLDQLWVK
jgi:peptide/nickel transport system substrate-binding protein